MKTNAGINRIRLKVENNELRNEMPCQLEFWYKPFVKTTFLAY